VSLCLYALENPFVECRHPQAEALRVYGRMWIQRVGLVKTPAELERFDAALYWQLIAEAYPEAPWEILSLAHDWSCWGFYLDDFDDSSEASSQPGALRVFFEGIQAVLRSAPISAGAPLLLQVVDNIWQRMYFYSSSEWRSRFATTLGESLAAYQWEAQNRLTQHIPGVAEYMDYRRKTGGWRTLVLLVDLAIGHTLPEQYYCNPALQRLLDTANNIICWSNDLFSFEKEQAVGEIHNLIPVVQAANQCSVGEAMQTIVGWHNQEVQRWKVLVQQMPHWSLSPREAYHVQRYIQFCEHYMYANHVWSQTSGRYHRRAVAS
jgi:hypothetical protein